MKNKTRLARQLLSQFILSFLLLSGGLILLSFLAETFLSSFTWQAEDALYQFFYFFETHRFGILLLACGLLWIALTFYFLFRAVSYLDSALYATKELLAHPEKPILLPASLYEFESEMNQIRQISLKNQQAAKLAEQKKNDLIVYLAHDLRTPLTSVIGYLTLLQESPELPVKYRSQYAGIALDKAYRLEGLLGEFFEITRFNLSQLSLTKTKVDLSLMVAQFASEFSPILQEKNLTWDLNIEKGISVPLDPEKFERVLDNLIKNAINYAPENSPLSLTLHQEKNEALLILENQGVTLDEEKLQRIFEPFFRGDVARKSTTGGTGLGLSIAKQIVELHGGTLQAKSQPNHFSLFLTLPLEKN